MRVLRLIPALLVALSLFLVLAGNRWGSYFLSPLPGIYLADLLFGLAALSGLALGIGWQRLAQWVFLIYGLVALYLVVLAIEIARVPSDDWYPALRDASPYLYLLCAPAVAFALVPLRAKPVVWFIRWTTVIASLGPLLAQVGLLQPQSSPILGSPFAPLFAYRGDLTGVAIAIGVIAWMAWPKVGMQGSLLVQFALLAISGVVVGSRSGLLVVVVAFALMTWVQVSWMRRVWVGLVATGLLLLGGMMSIPTFGILTVDSTTTSPARSSLDSTIGLSSVVDRSGTVLARLDTWTDVLAGMSSDGTLLIGGAAGSDYLYELCTGIKTAPPTAEYPQPKCAVDDHGPSPVLRDPHNWILNLTLTHGLIGLFIFTATVALTAWKGRSGEMFMLAGCTGAFYLIMGMTSVISAGYALIPLASSLGWIISRTSLVTRQSVDE